MMSPSSVTPSSAWPGKRLLPDAKVTPTWSLIVVAAFLLAAATGVFVAIVEPSAVEVSSVAVMLVAAAVAVGTLFAWLITLPIRQTLWVWVIVGVLVVGNVVKSYRFWKNLDSYEFMKRYPELSWVSYNIILSGLRWIAVALITVSLACGITLLMQRRRRWSAQFDTKPATVSTSAATILASGVFGVTMVAAAAQQALGVGVLGTATQHLPFRIDTFITRFLNDLSPTLLLLAFWIFDHPLTRTRWKLTGIALLTSTALLSLLSTSRGAFVQIGLPIVFLWLLTRRLTKPRLLMIGAGLLIVLVTIPFLSTLRVVRLNSTLGLSNDIGVAIDVTQEEGIGSTMASSVDFVTSRVVGAEGVWYAIMMRPKEFTPARVFDIAVRGRVSSYYTLEIVGVTRPGDFRAPGLVGVLMLLGGEAAVVMALLALYVFAAGMLWFWLSTFRTAPVVLAAGAHFLIEFTADGGMDIRDVIVFLMAVLLCEFVYRYWLVRRAPGDVSEEAHRNALPKHSSRAVVTAR